MGSKRLGSQLTQRIFNDVLDSIEQRELLQHGRGVLSGCHLSPVTPGSGFQVRCDEGIVAVECAKKIAEEIDIFVEPNSVSYVWRSESGQTLVTSTTDPVGGLFVCVGRVVSGNDAILAFDGTGRQEPARMDPERQSFVVRGEILPKGPLHFPVSEVFTDDHVVLTTDDRNIQVISCGQKGINVTLPELPHIGNWFRIINDGDGGALNVQALCPFDGMATLATVKMGYVVEFHVRRVPDKKGVESVRTPEERKLAKFKDRRVNEWFPVTLFAMG